MSGFHQPRRPARFRWPIWPCVGIDKGTGSECGGESSWMRPAVSPNDWPWTYCAHHAPVDAVPIPDDLPFTVTRVELRVALTGMPGDRRLSAEEAVRRLQNALEAAGAAIVGLKVVGQGRAAERPDGHGLRLTLAGPAVRPSEPFWPVQAAESIPSRHRRRHHKRTA